MYAIVHISVQGKPSEGSKNTNISHLNKDFKKSFAKYLVYKILINLCITA